jgi:hypothetical protein
VRRHALRLGIAVAGLALLGFAPGTRAEPKLPVDPSLAASDATLLQDEAKAIAEFQNRLRGQVSYRNGVLVIIDRSGATSGVTVMPATALWGIDCGDGGLAVTFGSGSGDTDNGVVLQLSSATISDDKCTRIAPALGEAVLALTKGN